MTAARELLDIAAEYVVAREAMVQAEIYGATPLVDLDEIAGRFDRSLAAYVSGEG